VREAIVCRVVTPVLWMGMDLEERYARTVGEGVSEWVVRGVEDEMRRTASCRCPGEEEREHGGYDV
jgi:hypothetical protein